jgi:hypothetical protein
VEDKVEAEVDVHKRGKESDVVDVAGTMGSPNIIAIDVEVRVREFHYGRPRWSVVRDFCGDREA